jgi:phenylacetate-CoA ligase
MDRNLLKRLMFWTKYGCFRRQAIPFYRELIRNQYMSLDELQCINWSKRRKLLAFAFEHSPFYHAKYVNAGLCPGDINQPEDFEKVPCVTRENLRISGEHMLIPDAQCRFLSTRTTGGSTGVPVRVVIDKRVPTEAIGWRMMNWWGVEPYMDGGYVLRMPRKGCWEQLVNRAIWWPTRKLRMDASSMSEAAVREFITRFNDLRPPLLQGYAGAIHHVAMAITSQCLSVHSPLAVWVTASPMSEIQRQLIERAFGAPVYDQYGSCEVGWYAAQCREQNGMHINCDTVHVEFVNHSGHAVPVGEMGNVVVTDLHNAVFPMIRYINGDCGRALPGKCRCGVTLPLMDRVRGRVSDMIRLPSGRVISGEYLTTIFDAFPDSVKQFQVRQASDAAITVLCVPNTECNELVSVLSQVRSSLEAKVDYEVLVLVKEVASIAHDRGKLRFVISDIVA